MIEYKIVGFIDGVPVKKYPSWVTVNHLRSEASLAPLPPEHVLRRIGFEKRRKLAQMREER